MKSGYISSRSLSGKYLRQCISSSFFSSFSSVSLFSLLLLKVPVNQNEAEIEKLNFFGKYIRGNNAFMKSRAEINFVSQEEELWFA